MLLFLACTGPDDTAPDGDADTDSDADTDADTDTDPVVIDTGLALTYAEGMADLTATTWLGEESYVATSMDGTVEDRSITNVTEGGP